MGLDTQITQGEVRFQTGPIHFLIPLYQGDPEYFHLVLPGFFAADDDVTGEDLQRICGQITRRCKGAQLVVGENGVVVASTEMVVAPPDCLPTVEHLMAVLPRTIVMLQHAVREFFLAVELHGIARASSHE
jgi:hypothetical protein